MSCIHYEKVVHLLSSVREATKPKLTFKHLLGGCKGITKPLHLSAMAVTLAGKRHSGQHLYFHGRVCNYVFPLHWIIPVIWMVNILLLNNSGEETLSIKHASSSQC